MEYYEKYIGQLSVKEFLAPFANDEFPIESAIQNVIETWSWDEPVPKDFGQVIRNYVESND